MTEINPRKQADKVGRIIESVLERYCSGISQASRLQRAIDNGYWSTRVASQLEEAERQVDEDAYVLELLRQDLMFWDALAGEPVNASSEAQLRR